MNISEVEVLKKSVHTSLLDITGTIYKDNKSVMNWLEFLEDIRFTYKYTFAEQMQIHTQSQTKGINPRAVATLDIWNKFGYIFKGVEEKPIHIIARNELAKVSASIKQVYDISQLKRIDGKDKEILFKLWDKDITPEKAENLKKFLTGKYNLKLDEVDKASLNTVVFLCLESKYKCILDDNESIFAVGENIRDIVYGNIGFVVFVSTQIMVIARLGAKARATNEEIISHYEMIKDSLERINTKDTITTIGELTNAFAKEIFSEIEIEFKKSERELAKANNISKGESINEQN